MPVRAKSEQFFMRCKNLAYLEYITLFRSRILLRLLLYKWEKNEHKDIRSSQGKFL